MIAPKALPPDFASWNERWGAPFGRSTRAYRLLRSLPVVGQLVERSPRWRGPFGFQANNDTRAFEYPWAIHAARLQRGQRVLDVGGSVSGLQFVLDSMGLEVHNCDPGLGAHGTGWPVSAQAIARLNAAFGTRVTLHHCFLHEAGFPDAQFDRVFCISAIEHIPPAEIPRLMREIARVLKPGGLFVVTVDLFLNLRPFTERDANRFGTNIDVRALGDAGSLRLVEGNPAELLGHPQFRASEILARLDEYLVGSQYPVLAQCAVFEKP